MLHLPVGAPSVGWFRKAAGWLVAGLITALAVVVAFWYRHVLRDRASAATARANAAERNLAPEIKRKQQKLDALVAQAGTATIAVKKAQVEVNVAKAKLADEFQSHGLTADEIVARFERLQLAPADSLDRRPPTDDFGG